MTEKPKQCLFPDGDKSFVNAADMAAFSRAIKAPDVSEEDHFISALNDWRPVHQRVKKKRPRRRGRDETREGFVYTLMKWPLLLVVFAYIAILSLLYVLTRFYISQYEYWVTWRGRRNQLRKKLRAAETYEQWKEAALELDNYLGAEEWKEDDAYAYYDYVTVRRIVGDLKKLREKAEAEDRGEAANGTAKAMKPAEELKTLIEMCVKNNFAGIESARMYSQTYYGTKYLVQDFIDEVEKCLKFLSETNSLSIEERRVLFKHLSSNYGKTALCLSGGACFSYYHFGVVKAHLDANLLPNIVTGTSGGALVASLVCTRTDEELRKLLVPELADKITACHDSTFTWIKRWIQTGARFDSVDWAERCCWFTHGSMTFKEAYERTGRILNISCVPSDPHTPSLLLNYLTAPDCCIFSAVLASAAVPGILNPVVLMTKTKNGTIAPYIFGNKWKDGSLRTDIPIRSLNLYFNVNFTVVSQVNPHVNIFFFASRGAVGRPVTHRRGKGWRGGFLGSAVEQYLKLDMAKWLKVLRHLELLPRPMSQDWSSVFLQKFDGTITIWPKTVPSDFWYILTDPTRERLGRMLKTGRRCTYPKLKFVENRLKIERMVERGRYLTRSRVSELEEVFGSDDVQRLLSRRNKATDKPRPLSSARKNSVESPTSLSTWFPWSRSTSFDAGVVNSSATEEAEKKRAAAGEGRYVGADMSTAEDSTSDAFSEGEMEGRPAREGEPVEKFEARGETVLGA